MQADQFGPNQIKEEESQPNNDLKTDIEHAGSLDDAVPNTATIASSDSTESCMEPFDDYNVKVTQLLDSIGFHDFTVQEIQHGYGFMNCVYRLTSSTNCTEQYILRVAIDGSINESDGKHETLENDIALLEYLGDKLPVPRIKTYSLTADNILEAAYTIQTMIPGQSLNKCWDNMDTSNKQAIIDQYIDLIPKLESITFEAARTFAVATTLSAQTYEDETKGNILVDIFDPD